jgi:hypothetical protein
MLRACFVCFVTISDLNSLLASWHQYGEMQIISPGQLPGRETGPNRSFEPFGLNKVVSILNPYMVSTTFVPLLSLK